MNILTFITILRLYSNSLNVTIQTSFYSYLTDNYYKEILKLNEYYNLENTIDIENDDDYLFQTEEYDISEYTPFINHDDDYLLAIEEDNVTEYEAFTFTDDL